MKRIGLVTAWLALAALVTTATWRVVGAAENQVGDNPVAPVVALTLPPTSASGSSLGSTPTTASRVDRPTTSAPATPTSPTTGSTTTATTSPATASTVATSAPATTSVTAGTTTIPSPGGTVTVSYAGSQVFLEAASPAIGFTAEVDHSGPDEVRVEFEGDPSKVTIRARMEHGRLVTEVSVSGDG